MYRVSHSALNPQLSSAGVQPVYLLRKLESLDLSIKTGNIEAACP